MDLNSKNKQEVRMNKETIRKLLEKEMKPIHESYRKEEQKKFLKALLECYVLGFIEGMIFTRR